MKKFATFVKQIKQNCSIKTNIKMKKSYIMKTMKSLLMAGVALLTLNANAVNRLYVPDFDLKPGETKEIELRGVTEFLMGGFQCRILPPAGLTWEKSKGKYHVSFDDDENEIYPSWLINESKVLTKDDPETTGIDDTGALSLMWAKWTGGDTDNFYEINKDYCFMILKCKAADDYDNSGKLLMYNMRYSNKEGTKTTVIENLEVATNGGSDVIETLTEKEVQSVKYFNLLGVESAEPFQGVNVVVTTYSDGTKSAQKVVK